jgi:glucosyl-3-phosphoglycerate synthase
MSDFYQHHHFTTLHRLARLPLEEFEGQLEKAARRRRMALLLPSLATEMDGEALPKIVEELNNVRYIHRVVVALDRADEADTRRRWRPLPNASWPRVRTTWRIACTRP